MDWTKIIRTNREALSAVIAEIAALLALALTGTALEWPHEIEARARRLLRPAEAALRRLIIIIAKDIKVKLPPPRAMPQGLVIKAKGPRSPRFKLYDVRKRFPAPGAQERSGRRGPRIRFIGVPSPLIPAVLRERPAPNRMAGLKRRFAALKQAFETLPGQARRMARWRLRRALKAGAKFTSPLRPGRPPGAPARPRLAVDFVLEACHGLAFDVLRPNSS